MGTAKYYDDTGRNGQNSFPLTAIVVDGANDAVGAQRASDCIKLALLTQFSSSSKFQILGEVFDPVGPRSHLRETKSLGSNTIGFQADKIMCGICSTPDNCTKWDGGDGS